MVIQVSHTKDYYGDPNTDKFLMLFSSLMIREFFITPRHR